MGGGKRQVLWIDSLALSVLRWKLIMMGWICPHWLPSCAELGLSRTELDGGWLHWQQGASLSLLSVGCFGWFVLWFSKPLCLALLIESLEAWWNKFWQEENEGLPFYLGWVEGHACDLLVFLFFLKVCWTGAGKRYCPDRLERGNSLFSPGLVAHWAAWSCIPLWSMMALPLRGEWHPNILSVEFKGAIFLLSPLSSPA